MAYYKLKQDKNYHYTMATPLMATAILLSTFHFWPFHDNKMWQLLCPSNLSVLVGVTILAIGFCASKQKQAFKKHLPHISIFAYLLINVLSLAFSPDTLRSIIFIIKLILMFVGAYTLFSFSFSSKKRLATIYILATIALTISVTYCLVGRFSLNQTNFGFNDSAYKYGTYIGVLVPLCSAFLILSKNIWAKLLSAFLVVGSIISSGSLGAICAIVVGLLSAIVLMPRWSTRLGIFATLAVAALIMALSWSSPAVAALKRDVRFGEDDGSNLKQRYIEWQAELNLLEDRAITGTGAGCINEYRSEFYHHLPKLNTLKPFDQNGWIATTAEVGIFGLVCFCWIISHYFKLTYSQIKRFRQTEHLTQQKFAIANFAGLVGACVANAFSSVYYNGILIIFVLVLAVIAKTTQLSLEE